MHALSVIYKLNSSSSIYPIFLHKTLAKFKNIRYTISIPSSTLMRSLTPLPPYTCVLHRLWCLPTAGVSLAISTPFIFSHLQIRKCCRREEHYEPGNTIIHQYPTSAIGLINHSHTRRAQILSISSICDSLRYLSKKTCRCHSPSHRLALAGTSCGDRHHPPRRRSRLWQKPPRSVQIAAHISSATPMPDGTSPTKAGVVIVTPSVDATSIQLPFLSSLGADLSRIEILSYVYDPENSSHPSGYRPFSLPEDFPRLFEAVERVNASLIIFDPFINLLSHQDRWTDQRLDHLLADLNQHLIERNMACLLIRNCPAKGGHARPSVLERSERFLTHATSRLLLAPDPINPSHLLLTHVKSRPPYSSHSHSHPPNPKPIQTIPKSLPLPSMGSHCLLAHDFLTHRPEASIVASSAPIFSRHYRRYHRSHPRHYPLCPLPSFFPLPNPTRPFRPPQHGPNRASRSRLLRPRPHQSRFPRPNNKHR